MVSRGAADRFARTGPRLSAIESPIANRRAVERPPMTLDTYRIEVRAQDEGIDADVYDGDDLVAESTRVSYDEYGLEAPSTDADPSVEREVTTDVTTIDLQYERDGASFTFRLLGDRSEIATVRVDDEEWGLDGS